jgi:hypothetical protein
MTPSSEPFLKIDSAVQELSGHEAVLRAYLQKVADQLVSACSRADVFCVGSSMLLEECGDGEQFGGHFFCSKHGLKIASRYSGDLPGVTEDEDMYLYTPIEECPREWLPIVSRPEVIQELTGQVLERVLKKSDLLRTRIVNLDTVGLPPETAAEAEFSQLAADLDFDRLAPAWRKAQTEVVSNPPAAALAACRMIESVCKHIIVASGKSLPDKLNNQVNEACAVVKLSADPTVASKLREVIHGLKRAISGIGDVRNDASHAHGASQVSPEVTSDEAWLAVNAAGVIVTFLLERWKQNGKIVPPAPVASLVPSLPPALSTQAPEPPGG